MKQIKRGLMINKQSYFCQREKKCQISDFFLLMHYNMLEQNQGLNQRLQKIIYLYTKIFKYLRTFKNCLVKGLLLYKYLQFQFQLQFNSMTQTAQKISFGKQNKRGFKGLKIDLAKLTLKNDITRIQNGDSPLDGPQPMGRRRRQTIGGYQKKKPRCEFNEQLIQEKFSDLFEKKQKLGEGAHSTVFQCIEKKTQKVVAAKFFKNCDCQQIRDIKKTFLIMKQLNHPYILKAENLFIQQETLKCYFTSQICKYGELREFIQSYRISNRRISEEKIAGIIRKVLIALRYLKENGVCHRDIKPENIMYNPETDEIKIIDFELSRMKNYAHQVISLWTDTGSIFYRAPESFAAGYGESIDLWAVGVIAFEMLTGKLPFVSNLSREVTNLIINQQIDFDALDLSNEAKRFLKGMLQKNPQNRFTPEEALTSSFILKNAPLELLAGVEEQHVAMSPIVKRSNTAMVRLEGSRLKFYDESFTAYVLRKTKRDNGIRIIY